MDWLNQGFNALQQALSLEQINHTHSLVAVIVMIALVISIQLLLAANSRHTWLTILEVLVSATVILGLLLWFGMVWIWIFWTDSLSYASLRVATWQLDGRYTITYSQLTKWLNQLNGWMVYLILGLVCLSLLLPLVIAIASKLRHRPTRQSPIAYA